jgi:hypothetical protein
MAGKMDYKVELVARALYEAEPEEPFWDNLSALRKERFRQFARNAISLLHDDIGILLLALEQSSAEDGVKGTRLVA